MATGFDWRAAVLSIINIIISIIIYYPFFKVRDKKQLEKEKQSKEYEAAATTSESNESTSVETASSNDNESVAVEPTTSIRHTISEKISACFRPLIKLTRLARMNV